MIKNIKSILFVVCAVMVFTAQANRPDDKGKPGGAGPRPAPQARTAPAARQAPASRPQVQVSRQAPRQAVERRSPVQAVARSVPRVDIRTPQPLDERGGMPRVYAVPAPSAPARNDLLFNRQHHNKWQPLYNFYNGQYNFYPYVNVNSPVEISADFATVLFNGQNFYYDRGRFYQQDDQGRYFAVPPPIGIIVTVLPQHARQVNVDGQVYFRYKGIFYVQVDQGFQVVDPVQSEGDAS